MDYWWVTNLPTDGLLIIERSQIYPGMVMDGLLLGHKFTHSGLLVIEGSQIFPGLVMNGLLVGHKFTHSGSLIIEKSQ